MLTVSAAVLLVPAFAALLGVERHRHLAQSEDSTRRARVAVAATLVGLAALATTALLDADPVPALAVAVVLAISVLVWSPLSRSWAVRGVVVWALLVSGVLGFMAWLAQQIWVTTLSAGERLVSVAGWLLLLLAITRVQHYVRPVIGAQAGLVPGEAVAQHIPILRPVLSLVALLAASGVVVAVTTDDDGPAGDDRSPQAGLTGSFGTTGEPGPAGPTLSASPTTTPSATRTGGPTTEGGGTTNVLFAGGGDVVAGVSVERPAAAIVPPGASCPTTGPADPGGVVAPSKSLGARPQPGARPDAGRTPKAPKPSGGAAPSTSKPEPMPGAKPVPRPPGSTPAPDPGEPLITNPDAVPSPVVTEIARSLGFDKDKPNRPSKAPAPAAGRPDHAHTPVLPASESPTQQPTIYPTTPVPVPPASAPPEPVPLDDKTYGYEKEKPNRPSGAPSPGHGRPSAS
jgi:hypothetical protein